ncbi:hypothetical protein ALP14_200178 [Pseudomonas amygdali pv. myricae]|nr:hypothetical protein ALP14_200178 [Pseudomonas amygdali pv. myricae]
MMEKIRRMYFRDKLSLHQIAKRTGLSRNTIRKWLRAPETKQPVYQRQAAFNNQPFPRNTGAGSQSRFASGKTQPQNRKGSLRADQSRGLRRRLQPTDRLYGVPAYNPSQGFDATNHKR